MKYTLKNNKLTFVSDSYNVEPWVLQFNGENINYFWRPPELDRLGTEVFFPLFGFLPNDKYRYNGKEYSMETHGFAHFREFTVTEKSDTHITYELVDDKGTYQEYPWHFRLTLTYALEADALKTLYHVENRDEKELFFSVGGHPRYTCPIEPGSTFEDYYIEFEKPENTADIVKSYGPISEIEKCFSPDGKKIKLDYNMFTKGSFCFRDYHSRIVCLKNDKIGRGLRIDCGGANHLQFWTRPKEAFLAIEPAWGSTSSFPADEKDCDWTSRQGTVCIQAGRTFSCAFSVTPLR